MIIELEKKEEKIKSLQKKCHVKDTQLSRLRSKIQALEEQLHAKDKSMQDICRETFEGPMRSFILDQIENQKRSKNGHRFSNETKRLAMAIHYISPKVKLMSFLFVY